LAGGDATPGRKRRLRPRGARSALHAACIAERGIVLARISRPAFAWAPVDDLVNEMIDQMMGLTNR
jgi:hypothetical protein